MDGRRHAEMGGIDAPRRLSAAVVSSVLAHGALAALLMAPHAGGRASIERALAVFAASDAVPERRPAAPASPAALTAPVRPRAARPPDPAPPQRVPAEAPPGAPSPRVTEIAARPEAGSPAPTAVSPATSRAAALPPAGANPVASAPNLEARAVRPAESAPQEARPAALPPSGPPGLLAVPRSAHQPAPAYPESARRAGVQGTSILKVRIVETGAVGEVLVAGSSGAAVLDAAAVEAVRRWRFVPARRGGEAVAVWVSLPVRFELE